MIKLAILGQPNCGKTTLFNALTGAHQHVGNYSGVTVERHVGTFALPDGARVTATDLPGTYSLCANSEDEAVVQRTLLNERFDLLVNVIDSSQLGRNLYLSVQLMSVGFPVLLVLNMTDEAAAKGIHIDAKRLCAMTGCPVVKTVGRTGKGLDNLKRVIAEALKSPSRTRIPDWAHQGDEHLRSAVMTLCAEIRGKPPAFAAKPSAEWVAVKLLEKDALVSGAYLGKDGRLKQMAQEQVERLESAEGEQSEVVVADFRYGVINALVSECQSQKAPLRQDVTLAIDRAATHRVWGLPIFFLLMCGMFWFTFAASRPVMAALEHGFGVARAFLESCWPAAAVPWLRSLAIDGVMSGVCGVLAFLPNILTLYLCLALIEGTGYMARAAFLMDRAMRTVGLHGKSFIALLTGFGCSVPAIMATRTLESRRDRMITLFIVPLMSCSARLPVYMLIIAAFFPSAWQAALAGLSVYLIGVAAGFAIAAIMNKTLFRGEASDFILEMPPYRLPTFRSIMIHMWERARLFLQKAGTIILAISVVFWFATTYPKTGDLRDTISGRIGCFLEPAMRQVGFDWQISTALVGAMAAKEALVSQLAIVTSAESQGASLRDVLAARYTPLQGYVLMLFCLIATPCVATFAVVRRETGSWLWAFAQQVSLTLLAYAVCLIVYRAGLLLGG
ncbi:MAG: ferrous iron transport protein B [Kiritimatiellaeota bacterium]|nr:ferrous iron transport protein B [Kiritimatiellota bacterium]